MRKNIFRKSFVVGIIILFVGAGIIPSTIGTIKEKTVLMNLSSRGYIQDLIDNASNGDTIYVPSGTYYENIIINKSISLVGEDKNNTIIDGEGGWVVSIEVDWVNISGFTIQNGTAPGGAGGIIIGSCYNNIFNNIITNSYSTGIGFFGDNNAIFSNTITNNGGISGQGGGIGLSGCNNTIFDNNISNNMYGIYLEDSSGNNITDNNITSNNDAGIALWSSSGNTITGNNISNNWIGLYLQEKNENNLIYHNNFIDNTYNANDEDNNIWDDGKKGNYWSDYEEKYPNASKIWWKGIWDTPYEIQGNNKDNYPLIKPFTKPRIRTVTRNISTFNSLFYWLYERFPFLEILFNNLRRFLG